MSSIISELDDLIKSEKVSFYRIPLPLARAFGDKSFLLFLLLSRQKKLFDSKKLNKSGFFSYKKQFLINALGWSISKVTRVISYFKDLQIIETSRTYTNGANYYRINRENLFSELKKLIELQNGGSFKRIHPPSEKLLSAIQKDSSDTSKGFLHDSKGFNQIIQNEYPKKSKAINQHIILKHRYVKSISLLDNKYKIIINDKEELARMRFSKVVYENVLPAAAGRLPCSPAAPAALNGDDREGLYLADKVNPADILPCFKGNLSREEINQSIQENILSRREKTFDSVSPMRAALQSRQGTASIKKMVPDIPKRKIFFHKDFLDLIHLWNEMTILPELQNIKVKKITNRKTPLPFKKYTEEEIQNPPDELLTAYKYWKGIMQGKLEYVNPRILKDPDAEKKNQYKDYPDARISGWLKKHSFLGKKINHGNILTGFERAILQYSSLSVWPHRIEEKKKLSKRIDYIFCNPMNTTCPSMVLQCLRRAPDHLSPIDSLIPDPNEKYTKMYLEDYLKKSELTVYDFNSLIRSVGSVINQGKEWVDRFYINPETKEKVYRFNLDMKFRNEIGFFEIKDGEKIYHLNNLVMNHIFWLIDQGGILNPNFIKFTVKQLNIFIPKMEERIGKMEWDKSDFEKWIKKQKQKIESARSLEISPEMLEEEESFDPSNEPDDDTLMTITKKQKENVRIATKENKQEWSV